MIAFEYLLFLIGPLIKHFQRRLDSDKSTTNSHNFNLKRWLLISSELQHEKRSFWSSTRKKQSNSLATDILAFYRWQQTESVGARAELLARTIETMRTRWPQLSCRMAPIDPANRQLNCWPYDLCLVDDWDFPELAPFQLAADCKHDDDSKNNIKIISSNSLERKLLIQVDATPSSAEGKLKQQQRILCVGWSSEAQFERDSSRSSLAFCYAQVVPELAPLHSLLVELLQGAQLLEGCSLNDSSGGSGSGSGEPLLTRYQLMLMLVAYLNQKQAGAKDSSSLSSKLVGFLSTYSELLAAGKSVHIKPAAGRDLELELIADDATGSPAPLRIFDPLMSNSDAERHRSSESVDQSGKLGELFAHLNGSLDGKTSLSSLLGAALEFGGQNGRCSTAKDPKPTDGDTDNDNDNDDEEDEDEQRATRGKKLVQLRSRLAWDGSSILKGKFWAQLRWRRFLTNSMYLILLLLVRSSLFNYLENVRDGMQAEAKDDLAEFRKIIFDTSRSEPGSAAQDIMQSIEDAIYEEPTKKATAAASAANTNQPLNYDPEKFAPFMMGGEIDTDQLMETLVKEMLVALGGNRDVEPNSEDMKRILSLLKSDGHETDAEEEAKVDELKVVLEGILGRSIHDDDLSPEEIERLNPSDGNSTAEAAAQSVDSAANSTEPADSAEPANERSTDSAEKQNSEPAKDEL